MLTQKAKMRNSPRKRGSGPVSCNTPVEIFTTHQLLKIPLGELRNLAAEKHGIQVSFIKLKKMIFIFVYLTKVILILVILKTITNFFLRRGGRVKSQIKEYLLNKLETELEKGGGIQLGWKEI